VKPSTRLPADLSDSPVSSSLESRQAGLIDLSVSNPTECGFTYDSALFASLSAGDVARYRPDPQGALFARQAVSNDLARQGLRVPPQDIFLTSGTSEAYSFVFKLLGEPGDVVLFPTPGYPLIEHLAQAESLTPTSYGFLPHAQGRIDFGSLTASESSKPKVLVAISPHNPLGTYLDPEDALSLDDWCSKRGVVLVLDEVFWDFPWDTPPQRPTFEPKALTIHLGGLSKSVGLPQMKCSWLALRGPRAEVDRAKAYLDFLSDLYLSVGTPVQIALPDLLQKGAAIRQQIKSRLKTNLDLLKGLESTWDGKLRVYPAQAGWSVILELTDPQKDEESYALALLDAGVYAMPGYLFSMDEGVHFVVSLLVPEETLRAGLQRLTQTLLG